jgi:hypothetical protein
MCAVDLPCIPLKLDVYVNNILATWEMYVQLNIGSAFCEINKWDGHGFVPMATPVCCRQWRGRQSEMLSKNAFGPSCKLSVIFV